MRRFPGVSVRKDVCGGEACIAGTRIPVGLIHKGFMAGMSIRQFTTYFVVPLTVTQVETAIRYEMRRLSAPFTSTTEEKKT